MKKKENHLKTMQEVVLIKNVPRLGGDLSWNLGSYLAATSFPKATGEVGWVVQLHVAHWPSVLAFHASLAQLTSWEP